MARIKFTRESTLGHITIGIEQNGEVRNLAIRESTYISLGSPVAGVELDTDVLSALEREDNEIRAIRKALSLLSYSDKNRRTLTDKLIHSGFDPQTAREASDFCVRMGYIDENRQLTRLVLDEANRNLRGPGYISQKLVAKGYKSVDIESVLSRLVDGGEIDFKANFARLCEKKGVTDHKAKKVLMYKYGYASVDC